MTHGPDPGSPKYEAARALLIAELLELGRVADARYLAKGELYEIEPWIAMQIIGRLLDG